MTALPHPDTVLPAASGFVGTGLDVQAGCTGLLDAHFGLEAGHVAAFLGGGQEPKPEFFALLLGLKRPDYGQIRLHGRMVADCQTGSFVPAHKRGIGFVGAVPHLWPWWRVGRNIEAARKNRRSVFTPHIEQLMEHFGLAEHRNSPVHILGDEQQWLAGFLRAVIATEGLLIIEQVPDFLPSATRTMLFGLMRDIARQGVPVLVGCQHASDALRHSDQVLGIKNGHIGPAITNIQGMWHFAPDGTVDAEPGMVFDGAIRQRDLVYRLNSISFAGGTMVLPATGGEIGSKVKIRIRAQDVILAIDHPTDTSINNIFPGTLHSMRPAQDPGKVDVMIDIGRQQPCLLMTQILKRMADELHLSQGSPAYAMIRDASALPV